MKRALLALIVLVSFTMAQDFEYVGTSKCKMCHNKDEKGAQYTKWLEGPHAGAFETLKSDKAAKVIADKGISGNAWELPECLKCHTTGFGLGGYEVKDASFWNPAADDKDGAKAVKLMLDLQAVGCEACHGAGSEYKSSKVKKSIIAGEITATSVGLLEVNEQTCIACHNEESPTFNGFNFDEQAAEIAHPQP